MPCVRCLHDHVCVYVRMLAMLGMAGAAVASAAGLMTTERKYPCFVGPPCALFVRDSFSFVLLACMCDSEIICAARLLMVGVQHEHIHN